MFDWNTVAALTAVGISIYALVQNHRHKVLERRPWFVIGNMLLVDALSPDGARLIANVRHVSGGSALNVRFSVAIDDQTSPETLESAAIVPGDTVRVQSHRIIGRQVKPEDNIKWTFTFQDEFQNSYSITEVRSLSGKQIAYVPRKF